MFSENDNHEWWITPEFRSGKINKQNAFSIRNYEDIAESVCKEGKYN